MPCSRMLSELDATPFSISILHFPGLTGMLFGLAKIERILSSL